MGLFKDIQTDLELASVRMVTEYRDRLLVEAFRLCGNQADAEDLVGSVFKEVFAHNGGYDPEKGDLYSYLSGILSHLYARSKRRAVNRGTVAVDPSVLAEDESLATSCTDDEIFAHSDHDALRAAIQRLPSDYRDAVLLHYFSELPIVKVARILGISEGTVKWRLSMARKALADDLGRGLSGLKKPLAVLGAILLGAMALFGAYQLVEKVEEVEEVEKVEEGSDCASNRRSPTGILSASEQDEPSASFVVDPQAPDNASDGRFDLKQEAQAQEEQGKENSMNIGKKAVASIATVAGLTFGAAAKEVTIDSYVQDGLIAQWDGIKNVGKGEAHDPNATVWKDLVGNSDLPVVEGKGVFTENAFDCLAGKSGYAAGPIDNTIGTCQTLEIVLDRRGGCLPFSVGEGNKAVCFYNSILQWSVGGYGVSWSGTNTATFTFVYSNSKYYENGVLRNNGGKTSWGSANQMGIGAVSGYTSGYNYNGKIHSIRLYNRALTAEEIHKNALVDQRRFFGQTVDWPTVTVRLSAQEGGLVSVNGSTPAQSVVQEIDFGDEAVVSFSSTTGAALKYWEVEGGPRRFVSANEWSMSVYGDLTATAHVRPAGEMNRYADDYILDGLIAFWDGIENVGMGLPHNDATNVWKDLIGSRDLSLVAGNANFISNALARTVGSTSGKMAQTSATCANYKTIEIVCDRPTGTSLLFCGGDANHILGSVANGILGKSGGYYYTVSSPGTYAFVYDGNEPVAFYLDGVVSDVKSGSETWSASASIWLGSYGTGRYPYLGNYYSLRLYDRALTPEELYSNAQVDGARYFGRPIVEQHMYVDVRGGGKVAVDGGAAEASHMLTPQLGDVLHLEAVADEGWSFVAWETPDGLFYSTNALSPVIDYKMVSYCTLTAVFVETSKLSDKDVTNYVYDGLVGMWDGIVNAGHGKAHDSAATVWKDLVSSDDAALVEGNAAFGENALQCLTHASGASAELPLPFNGVKTLEVVCEKSNAGYPFVSGYTPFVGFSSGKVFGCNNGDLWVATTNLATYTFVYGGAEPVFYENGLRRYASNGFGGLLSCLDARIGLGSYAGKIHSIRVYDRVLSAEEIGHNADLDQVRFFDAPPVYGTREFRVRVTPERGGRVVVTGGTKVGDGEYLVREGWTFVLEAVPRAAREFTGWRESLGAYVNAVNVLSNRIELTAVADSEIVAGFDVRALFMTAGAANYVQDGLIAQWDGIENVGPGLQHDSAATVWKDLVGTRDLPLVANRGSFTSNALYCAGGGYAAGPTNALTSVQTIELVCKPMSSSLGYAVIGGGAASLTVSSDGRFLLGDSRIYRFVRNPTTLAWRSGAGYTADGVKAHHTLQNEYWSNADGQMFVGARKSGDYSWRGDVHAIRVYDRVLTDAELARNFLLDSIRFFGRERPKKRGTVLIVK